MRAPLKWAGGKAWLAPWLSQLDLSGRRLVEPFCGAAAASFGLETPRALLNDTNQALIGFLRCLQAGLDLPPDFRNESQAYYAGRARFNALTNRSLFDRPETAALFYYLNRTGFNGLCRFNRRGEFNVPFGRHRIIRYADTLREFQPLMTGWQFQSGDFEGIQAGGDDFVYCDPPYDGTFAAYSAGGFDWVDQMRLVRWAARLDVPVLLSNLNTPRIRTAYSEHGFELGVTRVRRRIAADGTRPVVWELLAWRNFVPPSTWAALLSPAPS